MLRPGCVSILNGTDVKKVFVSSGTVTVNSDSSCQITAAEAYELDHLDLSVAKKGLDEANQSLSSAVEDKDKILAQVGVDIFTAMVAAIEGK